MKSPPTKHLLSSLLLLTSPPYLALAQPTVQPATTPPFCTTTTPADQCAQSALSFAFTYGLPLLSFGAIVKPPSPSMPPPPLNTLIHQRSLRSASDREVVRPNADTLYSNVFFDLGGIEGIEVDVPEVGGGEDGGRYVGVGVYDFYGNNIANIGTASTLKHGKFLFRYTKTHSSSSSSPPPSGEAVSEKGDYAGVITLPTPYGQTLIRISTSNTTQDLDTVHALQDRFVVREIPLCDTTTDYGSAIVTANSTENGGGDAIPPLDLTVFQNPYYLPTGNTTIPEAVLRLTAKFAAYNEPLVPEDRKWVPHALELAGCKFETGTWTLPQGTNLTGAVAAANASVAALLQEPGSIEELGNGWTVFRQGLVGTYGGEYVGRYIGTGWGYLSLTGDQALYPSYGSSSALAPGSSGDDEKGEEEEEGKSIILHFSRRPPVKAGAGFWSVTMYGADLFFVDNEMGRYAVGDRSELRFADGTLVYPPAFGDNGTATGGGAGEVVGEDGPFDVLIQSKDVVPPTNWTSNWLPGPSSGEGMDWNLRWYAPEDELFPGGGYEYPSIEVVDVIRE
ncbi:unnamed protein product [Periconia digitata]|uniref:Uncharacterized protein n=1 Tax=Periconia digitata TaxID=1303443 RepID=A0A9W4U470_9PLEO|nr:unnamed protein product [Periconia digitata]